MIRNFILDNDGNPVEEPDVMKWARWFETARRHFKETKFGEVRVSTVFLGIDHNWTGEGPPILWETMVFGGALDGEQDRYSSAEDAKRGHEAMVARAWVESSDESQL